MAEAEAATQPPKEISVPNVLMVDNGTILAVKDLAVEGYLTESQLTELSQLSGEDAGDEAIAILISVLRAVATDHKMQQHSLTDLREQLLLLKDHNKSLKLALDLRQEWQDSADTVSGLLTHAFADLTQLKDVLQAQAPQQQPDVAATMQQVLQPLLQQVAAAVAAFQSAQQQQATVAPSAGVPVSSSSSGPQVPAAQSVPAFQSQQPANSVPASSSSGTSGGQQQQSQPVAARSSSSSSGEMSRLNVLLESIPLLTNTISVEQWATQVTHVLQTPAVQDLITRLSFGPQELALRLRTRVDKALAGVLSGLTTAANDSPEALIAALQEALPSDRVGLKLQLSRLEQRSNQSCKALVKVIKQLHEQFRVPMPDSVQEYELLTAHFPADAARFIKLALKSHATTKMGWSAFESICGSYDDPSAKQASAKAAADQPKQLQQQQQQQGGGKQVRFPSANGAGYSEEHPPPSPRQQQQQQRPRGGYGGKGGRFSDSNTQRYSSPPPDYGGHYGNTRHAAAGVYRAAGVQRYSVLSPNRYGPLAGGLIYHPQGSSHPRAAAVVGRNMAGAQLSSLLVTGRSLGTAAGVSSSSGLSEITPAGDPEPQQPSSSTQPSSSSAPTAGGASGSSSPTAERAAAFVSNSSSSPAADRAAAGVSDSSSSQPSSASAPTAAGVSSSSSSGPTAGHSASYQSLRSFFEGYAAGSTRDHSRRKPRGAERVVPDSPPDAAAGQAAADPTPNPALVRLQHQLSNVQLPMALRTLIAAIGHPDLQALRDSLSQLGQALEPQVPEGTSAAAAAGFLAAALLGEGAQAEQPVSPASAAAHQSSSSVAASAIGVNSSSSSNTAGRPASPYRDAVQSETATLSFTSPIKVTGDVNGRRFGATIDLGCALSIMDLSWFLQNLHVFFYPGSPVQLLSFEQPPPSLGVMLGGARSTAAYLLRNVPLGLGDGIYWVNFLVMPESCFEVTLGLEFMDAYAVQVSTKGYNNPTSSPRLLIPTPKAYCRPSVVRNWRAGCTHYNNCVPGQFSVVRERFQVAPVDPRTLTA